MGLNEKAFFPLTDLLRVCAGILSLIILMLSYIADPHVQNGIFIYICKSFFAFSMSLGSILLILGSFTRLSAIMMIIGLWMGAYAQLLGNSLLIPISFSIVLAGIVIKGPGSFTLNEMMGRKNF